MLLKGLLEKEELIKDKFSWKCVLSFIFFSVKKNHGAHAHALRHMIS